MSRPLFWFLMSAALVFPVAALITVTSPHACRLQVIPDYVTPISYKAILRLSPACTPDMVLRVRKSSTLSRKENGAKYQPIKPLTGAWEVSHPYTPVKNPVPGREYHTTQIPTKWVWQWYDPKRKQWLDAEVLHAAP